MKFFKNFYIGIASYFKTPQFIFKYGLWFYFLFPLILLLAIVFGGDFLEEELKKVNFSMLEEENIDYYKVLFIGIKAILVFVAVKLYKYIVLILLSPVLSVLSSVTEKKLTGNRYKFSFKQFWRDIERGIKIALRNMLIEIVLIVIWFVLAMFIEVLNPYTTYFVLVVGFFFYGFSLVDYTNERRRLSIEESVRFVRKHRGLVIATGSIFSLLFLIPYAGAVLAPILGIVAATIGMHEVVDLSQNEHAVKTEKTT